MFKWMGNKRLFVLLFGFIIFIAIMGLSIGKAGRVTWPEKMTKDMVSWSQGLFYKPARSIAGFVQDIHDLRNTYKENQILKGTLYHYAADTMRLNMLEAENKKLKNILQFTDQQKARDHYSYRVAEVVAESPDPYNHTIEINLGSKDGVHANMAVMTTKGLIGRVQEVRPMSSTVQLLSALDARDSSKAVAATVLGKETADNPPFGIISSFDRTTGPSGTLVMTKIPAPDAFQVGDTVITSGLGQLFPKGLIVGKVTKKESGDYGIAYKAYIQPSSSFNHLSYVIVVEVGE